MACSPMHACSALSTIFRIRVLTSNHAKINAILEWRQDHDANGQQQAPVLLPCVGRRVRHLVEDTTAIVEVAINILFRGQGPL